MCSGRCDDIHPVAGLLHPEATEKERANGRGKAPARVLWFLQSVSGSGHSAQVVGIGRLLSFFIDWGNHGFAPETTVLSRRRPILVLPRYLAAERCALDRNKRRCREGRAGCPPGCRRFGENGLEGGIGKASPHFDDEFHRWWWTTFLVFDLSRSSTDELCASHCSGERQRSHPETHRASSSSIEQAGAGCMDYRPSTANQSRRNSRGNSHLGAGG